MEKPMNMGLELFRSSFNSSEDLNIEAKKGQNEFNS